VEYRIPGINQVQTHAKAGLTFAAALRSILRADPDVILIGEIRDHETAQIAIESALTGHLVLTTLHTNDAPSVITRLTEMGIEPFLVGSALACATGQRLARRLCVTCRRLVDKGRDELEAIGFECPPNVTPTFYEPVGCSSCARTGYRGRLAMHEVMPMNEEIAKLAVKHASSDEVRRLAVDQGMRTLRQDGWLKVSQGLTTFAEVLRVVA
jgi:type IV pilus assembly protein PilB